LEKTVYPLIYSDKSLHMLRDIGFQGNCTDIRQMSKITVKDVIDNGIKDEKQRREKLSKLALDAKRQFLMLDKM